LNTNYLLTYFGSWTSSLEQSADGPQTAGLVMQPFQTVAEDVFCLTSGSTAQCESPLNSAFEMLLLHLFKLSAQRNETETKQSRNSFETV